MIGNISEMVLTDSAFDNLRLNDNNVVLSKLNPWSFSFSKHLLY